MIVPKFWSTTSQAEITLQGSEVGRSTLASREAARGRFVLGIVTG